MRSPTDLAEITEIDAGPFSGPYSGCEGPCHIRGTAMFSVDLLLLLEEGRGPQSAQPDALGQNECGPLFSERTAVPFFRLIFSEDRYAVRRPFLFVRGPFLS